METAQAFLSLLLSKGHIVGNHMLRLISLCAPLKGEGHIVFGADPVGIGATP